MITETSGKKELLAAINEAISRLQDLMASLDENKINTVPYKDSWTPGQLFRHVKKSIGGMANAMKTESKATERDPGEKIPHLKKAFLDFSNKMKSPDFIIPEAGPYEKNTASEELNKAFNKFKENTNDANLNELVEGLPLGEITKLEILHFVLYHTQRHLHQMKNITNALKRTSII